MIFDWSKPSTADLEQIRHWLVDEADPATAARILGEIRQQAANLENFPSRFPEMPGRQRKLIVKRTKYIIVYRVRSTTIEILRVHHASQNWRAPE